MNITEIVKGIHYVGVNDRNKHKFENLWPLPYGVSYNAYLITDEKNVLVDTADAAYTDRLLDNITDVITLSSTIWSPTTRPRYSLFVKNTLK